MVKCSILQVLLSQQLLEVGWLLILVTKMLK
jgi:hypothetical protein